MNQVTVHGQLVDQCGFVLQRDTHVADDRWTIETRVNAFQLRPENFVRMQRPVRLNYCHDPGRPLGRLVSLQHRGDGLWATFQSSDVSLLTASEPMYLSAEVAYQQHGGADTSEIRLDGCALVPATASTHTRPALILAGRLDSRVDRQRWRLGHAAREMLEQAADDLRHRKTDDPVVVRDRTPEHEQLLRNMDRMSPEAIYVHQVEQFEAWRREVQQQRPRGELEYRPSVITRVTR